MEAVAPDGEYMRLPAQCQESERIPALCFMCLPLVHSIALQGLPIFTEIQLSLSCIHLIPRLPARQPLLRSGQFIPVYHHGCHDTGLQVVCEFAVCLNEIDIAAAGETQISHAVASFAAGGIKNRQCVPSAARTQEHYRTYS